MGPSDSHEVCFIPWVDNLDDARAYAGLPATFDCSSFTLSVATEDIQKEIAEYSKRSSVRSAKTVYTPRRILRSGPATIVFREDGTKTVVKRAPDEEDNAYAAFTAALAIKIFGSNSKLKKMVKTLTEEQK
jgi:hypothetical protein